MEGGPALLTRMTDEEGAIALVRFVLCYQALEIRAHRLGAATLDFKPEPPEQAKPLVG